MSGPTLEDFEAAIEEYWHDRSPAGFEDVMALYGLLAVAEAGGELYGSASKLDPFVDDGRLITINIDLTGDTPKVETPSVDVFRREDIPRLGYAHKSSGRGAKYSLTQIGSKNGNDASGVISTVLGRIRSWTTQDSVQSVLGEDGHPDAWLIETLDEVFHAESPSYERLQTELQDLLPSDDSIPTVMTVRFKFGDQLQGVTDDTAGWIWPGDIEILNEAMRRYATVNAANKNLGSDTSEGESTGVVSGQSERVVGTPESPLGVFSVKHPDAQPGLRRDQSWRNYPVGADTAMLFNKGQDLIEECVLRRGGLETYTLPYFAGELTAQKAQTLYGAIQSLDTDSEYDEFDAAPMTRVTFALTEHENEEIQALAERELRFYTVTMPISDDKNIIAEEPAATQYWVSELADALIEAADGPTMDPSRGGFAAYPNWPLLDFPSDTTTARKYAFNTIAYHDFTDAAFRRRDEEGDDFRRIADSRLISGTPLDASMLFDEYLARYSDEREGGELPPHQIVVQQLVHLEALSRAGLLRGLDVPIEPQTHMQSDTDETDLDTTSIPAIRQYRVESFLDRPLFNDTARKAAALSGVLIGQVSWHQENQRGVGRPLDSTTSGDQLTPNGLENALITALEKAKVYALDSEYSSDRDLLFPETVDRLLECTEAMPTDWDVERGELRFCYVLGHAHGRRSMPMAFDLYESGDDEASSTEQITN
jgi:CRISPR-associated protein Cas8b/Csh1 subtype I-B